MPKTTLIDCCIKKYAYREVSQIYQELEISEQADNDLRGIFEYIAFELQSSQNASGQLDRLEE